VHAPPDVVGELLPRVFDAVENLERLGIVGDRRRRRARQHQVRLGEALLTGEAFDHAERVLERVPTRDLHDERRAGRDRRVLYHRGGPLDATGRTVGPGERRAAAARRRRLDHAGGADDRLARRGVEVLVLEGERVDARRDQLDAGAGQPLPDVGLACERHRPRTFEPGSQEVPRRAAEVVRNVDTDVAGPRDDGAVRGEAGDESERLRVVHDDDVAGPDDVGDRVEVPLGDAAVVLGLEVTERASVAEVSVETVVDPLRDVEEARVAFHHQPPDVDAVVPEVAQDRAQDLGHTASLGGGVHVPEAAPREPFAHRGDESAVPGEIGLGNDVGEAGRGARSERDLEHGGGGPPRSSIVVGATSSSDDQRSATRRVGTEAHRSPRDGW
jgi:hypothetical protein